MVKKYYCHREIYGTMNFKHVISRQKRKISLYKKEYQMANIRDYFRRKEKRDEKAPRISYKEKIRSHKFTVFYRSTLVLVLIAAVAAALFIQWKNKIYTESTVISSVGSIIQSNATLESFAGNLLTYSKDGASCTNAKGTVVWNVTFEMQNPRIDICQDVVAIGDYNGREIYVMNTEGSLGDITTNKPIRNFCVSANGVVAAVLDDSDVTQIYLYDSTNGKELVHFRTTMGESGYPFSVSISPNGELVCVSYLFVDSGVMKSSVAFYNFGEVGKNSTDNYVSGYDYRDDVVAYTKFLDERTAFAVSDDRIMFYSGAQKPVSIAESLLSEEIQEIVYGDGYVGLVYFSTDSSRYRLDIYNKSGVLNQSIHFDLEYSDIVFSDDQIIIYNEAECKIYNMNGMEKFSGLFSQTVYTLIPTTSSYRFLLVTPDSFDTIELK